MDVTRARLCFGVKVRLPSLGSDPNLGSFFLWARGIKIENLADWCCLRMECSILSRSGNKTEALKVLQKAARLEPKIQKYIDALEQELRTQADAANRTIGKH